MQDKNFSEKDLDRYVNKFQDNLKNMVEIFQKKNKAYNGAFFKVDNIQEAFEDVKRKYIRAKSVIDAKGDVKEIQDSLLDLANYAVMVNIYIGDINDKSKKEV